MRNLRDILSANFNIGNRRNNYLPVLIWQVCVEDGGKGWKDSFICYGLGAPTPKVSSVRPLACGSDSGRIGCFDMPASENAMTGVAIGAFFNGIRHVMTHPVGGLFSPCHGPTGEHLRPSGIICSEEKNQYR